MLNLNTDKKKSLDFDVSIQGIDHAELRGSLKFTIEGIEYGFPVEILEDNISVIVPPLKDVVKKGLTNGYVTDCKLEIFGNDFYLNPWSEQFQIKSEVKIEAKIKLDSDEEVDIPTVVVNESPSVDLIEDETPLSQEEEAAGSELLERLLGKYKNIKPKKRTVKKESSKKPGLDNKIEGIINEVLSGKSKPKKPVAKKKPIRESKKVVKKRADETSPIAFMESLGMTNPKTQKIMMEKAIDLGGDDDRAIMNTLKKLLLPSTQNPFEEYAKIHGGK
jgi:hypothetical protein